MFDRTHRGEAEQGGVLPLLALTLAMVMVSVLLLGGVLNRATLRAEAQAAADAAALAGAVEGRTGAAELASRNEAELVEFDQFGPTVFVVVERNGVRASAYAEQQVRKLQPRVPVIGLRGTID